MVVLHFVNWLHSRHPDWHLEVIVNRGGPLVEEFAEGLAVHVLDEPAERSAQLRKREMFRYSLGRGDYEQVIWRRMYKALHAFKGFDLLYMNSAASASALPGLLRAAPVLLTHIHELRFALGSRVPEHYRDLFLSRTDRFVSASHAAARDLEEHFDVPSDRIDVCHEFIDVDAWPAPSSDQRASADGARYPGGRLRRGRVGSVGLGQGSRAVRAACT